MASSTRPAEPPPDWHAANHRYMVASIALVRGHVERADAETLARAREALQAAAAAMPAQPAITAVERAFHLSPFERDLLVLCAGAEIDADLAAACAALLGDPRRAQPTFGLALSVLPEPHWSALGLAGPLRRHCLVDVVPGDGLARSPLRIQERVLHHLLGVEQPDERLAQIFEPAAATAALDPPSRALADRIAAAWREAARGAELPLIELCGPGRTEKLAIAAAACAATGLRLDVLAAAASAAAVDDDRLARLLVRETVLRGSALLLDAEDLDDRGDAPRWLALRRFAERFAGPVLVAARGRLRPVGRAALTLEIERPSSAGRVPADMGGMARTIDARATWEDLVLPEREGGALREIAIHVRQRAHLRERWGFARHDGLGLGVNALFAGPSGTGKTLAAEVLACELGLDLHRVDLSQVLSKYIGDTEKNLRRVFDAAEGGRAILLFDEADALFGPRSEVRDSHDRYANLEVAYLLQRMESYRGLSLLTTNMRDALDPAFVRRLHFIVDFPFPEAEQRARIWRRVFPPETPLDGVDFAALSRWNIAGGTIRNIVMAAASLAAEEGSPVTMAHVTGAARSEYRKLGRPLPEGLATGTHEPR